MKARKMKLNIFQKGGSKSDHPIILKAAEFFLRLQMSTRMLNTLTIRIEMRATKLEKIEAGVTEYKAVGSQKNAEFTIILPRDEEITRVLQTLAHETAHVRQLSTGQLQVRQWKTDEEYHYRWNNQECGVGRAIPWVERPWEKDAEVYKKVMVALFKRHTGNLDRALEEVKGVANFNDVLKVEVGRSRFKTEA